MNNVYETLSKTLKHFGYDDNLNQTTEVWQGRRENNKNFKEILEKLSQIPDFAENECRKITIEYDPTYTHFLVITTQPSMCNPPED